MFRNKCLVPSFGLRAATGLRRVKASQASQLSFTPQLLQIISFYLIRHTMGETAVEEKKRGRTAKPEAEKKRKATEEAGNDSKRGRGRPKGSGKKTAAKKATPKKGGASRRGRPKKGGAEEPQEEAAEE